MVRYIDTGSRDPKQALGTWLGDVLIGARAVVEVRIQSGFFGSGTLGYFEDVFDQLASSNAPTRMLIGSNDGETPRAALEDLLAVLGRRRSNLKLAVVSFQTGFFHPKVFHFVRADGSATAYVGSANLTASGVRSQHVEAGVILDTDDGDQAAVLMQIGSSIDQWFAESRSGAYQIQSSNDLDALVARGVIGVPAPPRIRRTSKSWDNGIRQFDQGHALYPLVAMPPIRTELPAVPPAESDLPASALSTGFAPRTQSPDRATRREAAPVIAHWSKKLPASDAQRKNTGNQSGAVALTQGEYVRQIDQTTYFRQDLFGSARWTDQTAVTGQPKQVARVPMRVTIDGIDHGILEFQISNASNRESGQNNYTAQLHLEPVSHLFRQTDMTGKRLEIERHDDGSFELRIS